MISIAYTLRPYTHRLAVSVFILVFSPSVTMATADHPGENIALAKPYTLWPQPNYSHCTDVDDRTQLTDGKSTKEYFWTQQGTVGWTRPAYSLVTVDLGRTEPIAGVAFTTAAGTAGVTWPAEIRILVSDDGKNYRDVGDLVALEHKRYGSWPEKYAIRRVITHELATRGRYVQFIAIPLAGAPYLFVDEVEVFRGAQELLQRDPGGKPVQSAKAVFERGRIHRALQIRYTKDAANLQKAIKDSSVDQAVKAQLLKRLSDVRKQLDTAAAEMGPNLRAVLPIGDAHANLFQVQADLWKAAGRPSFWGGVPDLWGPVALIGIPPAPSDSSVQVHTMHGEYRAASVNLYNATDQILYARVRFEELPGSPTPDYVTLHEVAWTDTAQSEPIAAALPEVSRQQGAWTVSVPPGLTRQVWFTFHVADQPAGSHTGKIVVDADSTKPLEFRIQLRIWPFEFPRQTTLHVGGWSYTNGGGTYGVTTDNLQEFLGHMQSHFVNAPWATSAAMMKFRFDPSDLTKIELDTQQFDNWIEQWPDAKRYHVFLSVADYAGRIATSLGGAPIDSPEFSQRVGTWISAWVQHLKSKGIRPDQLGLLIHDEPHEGSDLQSLLAWAKAIRAAEPEVIIWEDPTYRNPTKAPVELYESCDVLCPNRPMWLTEGQSFADFYLDQKNEGRTLEFYSCSGPAKLLDPYSYHRLQAWHCWKVGGTGSYFWAFGDNSGASSWCEYFAKSGPYTPLFLEGQTVTAGKHMEAIRESVEDYEYFVILRTAVERAKAAGDSRPAVAAAEELLAHGADTVLEAQGVSDIHWCEPKARTGAEAVRVKILEALLRLP
ncbi:F5/8 type C domain protein [Planctomycetes bacterium CA13]|uniref:F5/8 type C domain protein n=1 Tax=Novipirellula herctigrandis TaxID=2527986 RepID=A0A5C5Z268_9BACT|nr:F5/8 type C domain protein [Planctomycetes bacterium CA13]